MSAASIMAVVAVAGCGGGGSGQQGPALARPALVAQANAICAAAAQRIKDGASSVFPDPTKPGAQDPDLVITYANKVVLPALQNEYGQLSALRPTSDSNTGDTMSALEKAIDGWENDKTIMATVTDTTFARFDTLATDFGMTTCAATDAIVRTITTGPVRT